MKEYYQNDGQEPYTVYLGKIDLVGSNAPESVVNAGKHAGVKVAKCKSNLPGCSLNTKRNNYPGIYVHITH